MEKEEMSTQLEFRDRAKANSCSLWIKPKGDAPLLSNPYSIMAAHWVQR
jgi:hypothetical protein